MRDERNLKDKIYSAAITKDDALRAEGRELLSRQDYFGSVGRLVASDGTERTAFKKGYGRAESACGQAGRGR